MVPTVPEITLAPMVDVYLKKGRNKSARQHHPWLFSGAIGKVTGEAQAGEVVRVINSTSDFVAYGYFNPQSQICIRLLEWNEDRQIDNLWWHERLAAAINARSYLASDPNTDSYRLVFAESDFLPGLIVDKYASYLVVQVLTAGIERVKDTIVRSLVELFHPAGIYERSDVDIRLLEGLQPHHGGLYGTVPENLVKISENGLHFLVDLCAGQKTGFYLDQWENRRLVAQYAQVRDVLDCFCYTGAFSIYSARGGAKSTTLVDSSAVSLELARKNFELNQLSIDRAEFITADAFDLLREFRQAGRKFDMVILDPPKFAASRSQLKKALEGYKNVNLCGMNLLNPEGLLVTFSCSSAVDMGSFKKAIAWAGHDLSRPVQFLHLLSQPSDHPCLSSFPESEYLKGFICRVL